MSATAANSERHCGWTNWETWCVNLWLTNDQGTEELCQEMAEQARQAAEDHPCVRSGVWEPDEAPKYLLADMLKDFAEDNAPELQGLYVDLLNAALSEVDWHEIAESLLEE